MSDPDSMIEREGAAEPVETTDESSAGAASSEASDDAGWRPRAKGEIPESLAGLLRLPRQPGDDEWTLLDRRVESGLVIEEFRFDAEPGETASGILARPDEDSKRFPVILCLHDINQGRKTVMGERYYYDDRLNWLRGWGRELARHGFMTASITQRTFGKRSGDLNEQAKVELIYGRTLMGAFVWEALATLDLLSRREDADPNRMGMMGFGLGGVVAFYAAALDDRAKALATVCGGVGSMDLFARWSDPDLHDLSYYIPGILERFDHADIVSSLAPRAYLLMTRDTDESMPIEGVRRAEWEGGTRYREMAAEHRFKVSVRPGGHDFSLDELDEALNWMNQWLSEDGARAFEIRPLERGGAQEA